MRTEPAYEASEDNTVNIRDRISLDATSSTSLIKMVDNLTLDKQSSTFWCCDLWTDEVINRDWEDAT